MVTLGHTRLSETRNPILFLCSNSIDHFLTSQVAIHSVVEKLFRSIWSLPNNKAPVAIKYFFDFLDAQAESKKITDPDVVHIWKTNRYACMSYTGVCALCENVAAISMEQVTCDQKYKILARLPEDAVWLVDPRNFSTLIGYQYKPP